MTLKREWQNMALALAVVVGLLCYVAWLTDAPFTDNVKLSLLFAGSGAGLAICAWIARREMRTPTSLAWRTPTPERARRGAWLLLGWQGVVVAVLVILEGWLHGRDVDARSVEQVVLVSMGVLQTVGLLGVWYWSRRLLRRGDPLWVAFELLTVLQQITACQIRPSSRLRLHALATAA